MSHPNEELIRRLFETYRSGDRSATAGFFAEDAVFRYAGIGGLHGGREAIMRFWAEQDRLSGTVFMPVLVDLVAGDRNVFLLVQIVPADGGPSWQRVVVYEIADGAIAGASVFEADPLAAEAFFSGGSVG